MAKYKPEEIIHGPYLITIGKDEAGRKKVGIYEVLEGEYQKIMHVKYTNKSFSLMFPFNLKYHYKKDKEIGLIKPNLESIVKEVNRLTSKQ